MNNYGLILLTTLATISPSATFGQTQVVKSSGTAIVLPQQVISEDFSRLSPNPTIKTKLDYEVWDMLLKEIVFYTGPSLRRRASLPERNLGSRFISGHTSSLRLEGNKVIFEGFGSELRGIINDYIDDLVTIGNDINIATLSRDEQLAFWFNLHNVLVIDAIAENYPITSPELQVGPDGLGFHDTKRVTINGVPLSLRNIREDIVYKNWVDPFVIYGFFHGDIGSPSIQRRAFTAENFREVLSFSAQEFANSLRGFRTSGSTAYVSRHYTDASRFFFPEFDKGIKLHLADLLNPDLRVELDNSKENVKIASYEDHVADMTKGTNSRLQPGFVQSTGPNGTSIASNALKRAINENARKLLEIRKNGMMGTVTIEDIETTDNSSAFGEPRSIYIGPPATADDPAE